jgi:Xaa-Pro aminopeptidase
MSQTPSLSPQFHVGNRRRLEQLLLPDSLAVVNANDLLPANADATLGMVPNSDLFYLSGIRQEESILLLFPQADDEQQREILFLREPIAELQLWEGHKLSKEEARALTGITNIQWLSAFKPLFHRLMCECEHVYLNSNEHKRAVVEVETRDARFISAAQRRYPLHHYCRLARVMHRLRIIKSKEEINLIRAAVGLTNKAFKRILQFVAPGKREQEIEAEYAHEFIRHGARFAYQPIVASGPNACVLHYFQNSSVCRKGDLLLLDVGAAWGNYASDLTRTIPVSGRFTPRQRKVYHAVLRVLRQSIAGLVPGAKPKDWQKTGEQLMEKELVDLGLLKLRDLRKQDPNKPAVKKYFMHGLGHPLGLDVHDVGFTTEPFAPGWVMTVEPGIYIPEEGIGIRLENNALITKDKPVDLTADVPLEPDEIEGLMK